MLAFTKIFLYLFSISFLPNSVAKDYCGSNVCNNNKQHTLCKFPVSSRLPVISVNHVTLQLEGPAPHCLEYEKTIRTVKEKQAVLDKLNNRRNKVAGGELRSLPSAANMHKLEWNEELEESAQRWADQCTRHTIPDLKDTCRNLDGVYVGQNIATIYGEAPGITPYGLVDVWYMELLHINASVLPRYQSSVDAGYSHYEYFTQLVWANSRQVGCGGVKFKERLQDIGKEKRRVVHRIVCNFAPGGNIQDEAVYDTGPPCTKCSGTCDPVYPALCRPIKPTTDQIRIVTAETDTTVSSKILPKLPRSQKLNIKFSTDATVNASATNFDDDVLKPFDYFSHLHQYVTPTLDTTTKKATSCKDILVVDEFVELLKRKLSTDPMLKDFLQSSLINVSNGDNSYTDAMALISRLYSKKPTPTTNTPPESGYINSTLLVDLVEAVIFRNADKMKATQETFKSTFHELAVNPVKIQAELAEVNNYNKNLNGHLFFPEDIDTYDKMNTESTELYYDATNPLMSELETMRRGKATKDFLDEILDTETTIENPNENIVLGKRDITEKQNFNGEKNHYLKKRQSDYYDDIRNDIMYDDKRIPIKKLRKGNEKEFRSGVFVWKYKDLLKKLAMDLKPLKLSERFHCNRNHSNRNINYLPLIYTLAIKCIYLFT